MNRNKNSNHGKSVLSDFEIIHDNLAKTLTFKTAEQDKNGLRVLKSLIAEKNERLVWGYGDYSDWSDYDSPQ